MFPELKQTLESHLPAKRKKTPSGWTSFNAPCCHHNGESQDNRTRGGIMYQADGSVQYHCFNCGFKSNFTPGRYMNNRFRKLLTWLNVSSSEIGKLSMQAMRLAQEVTPEIKTHRLRVPVALLLISSISQKRVSPQASTYSKGKEQV